MFFKKKKAKIVFHEEDQKRKDEYIKNFRIVQIAELSGIRKDKGFERSTIVSSIYGRKVKDHLMPKQMLSNLGNVDMRYDSFRSDKEKKLSEEELIKKYGTKYYEFNNIINDESREKYLGSPVHIPHEQINQNKKNNVEKKYVPRPIFTTTNKTYENKEKDIKFVQKIETKDSDLEIINFVDDNNDFQYEVKDETKKEVKTYQEEKKDYEFEETILSPVEEEYKEPEIVFSNPEPEIINQKEENFETKNQEFKQEEYNKRYKYEIPKDFFNDKKTNLDEKPEWVYEQQKLIDNTLQEFGVEGRVVTSKKGPTVTRYEIELGIGVNVKKITALNDNLMMALSVESIRIEAPIPGKPYVGIEIPNKEPEIVYYGSIINNKRFENNKKPLEVPLGLNIDGEIIYSDITSMPHGLIAGATNSGKSVCVNTIILSLLLKNSPDDLKLILIDPKMVELKPYDDLPHLATPVITDARVAGEALKWAVEETEKRYLLFAENGVRNIDEFNEGVVSEYIKDEYKLPRMVIIIDELADLIMSSSQDVENSIQRLTQKARAAGIHLLVATQRPTTDIIRGTIKANIPTRLAFKVSSFTDSTTILDGAGAETLLGRGDMLYKENESIKRLQGAFVTNREIYNVVEYIKKNYRVPYLFTHENLKNTNSIREIRIKKDELLADVARYVIQEGRASQNNVQQYFAIGFNRTRDIFTELERLNIISKGSGQTKAREILVSLEELDEILEK